MAASLLLTFHCHYYSNLWAELLDFLRETFYAQFGSGWKQFQVGFTHTESPTLACCLASPWLYCFPFMDHGAPSLTRSYRDQRLYACWFARTVVGFLYLLWAPALKSWAVFEGQLRKCAGPDIISDIFALCSCGTLGKAWPFSEPQVFSLSYF